MTRSCRAALRPDSGTRLKVCNGIVRLVRCSVAGSGSHFKGCGIGTYLEGLEGQTGRVSHLKGHWVLTELTTDGSSHR